MRRAHLLLGAGAVALLGAGVWLGRSASATAQPEAPAVSAPAPARAKAVAPPPVLQKSAATRALQADLTDRDVKVRRAAMREAARDRSLDRDTALAASRDPDIEVGITATEALGKMYAAGELPAAEIISRAGDHALNEKVRLTAMNGLAERASPEGAAFLADRLANGDAFERLNASILIGHQDLEVAVPALIRALGDAEPRVRDNALEVLRMHARGRDYGTDAAAWQAWWQARPR